MKRSRLSPLRALASTVLRSTVVIENSAATKTAVPKVSAAMATVLTSVTLRFMGSAMTRVAAAPRRPQASMGPGRVPAARHPFRSAVVFGPGPRKRGAAGCEVHMVAKTSGTTASPAEGQRVALGESRRRLHPDHRPFMQLRQGRGADIGAGAAHTRGDVVDQVL